MIRLLNPTTEFIPLFVPITEPTTGETVPSGISRPKVQDLPPQCQPKPKTTVEPDVKIPEGGAAAIEGGEKEEKKEDQKEEKKEEKKEEQKEEKKEEGVKETQHDYRKYVSPPTLIDPLVDIEKQNERMKSSGTVGGEGRGKRMPPVPPPPRNYTAKEEEEERERNRKKAAGFGVGSEKIQTHTSQASTLSSSIPSSYSSPSSRPPPGPRTDIVVTMMVTSNSTKSNCIVFSKVFRDGIHRINVRFHNSGPSRGLFHNTC